MKRVKGYKGPRVILHNPPPRGFFDLTDDLRKRLVKQVDIPVTAKTYLASSSLLEELASYGKSLYANGLVMRPTDMQMSDRLSMAIAEYEVNLEKAQAIIKRLPVFTDILVEALTDAIQVTKIHTFDMASPVLENLEELKGKLTKAMSLVDQFITLKKQ